jgi:hypothetical protein
MGFSTTDWVAFFILGASALVSTFGKRLVRIIGLAVMPFALAGLVLSLNHPGSGPSQEPITNNVPSINTNNTNDQAGRQLLKELQDVTTLQLPAHHFGRRHQCYALGRPT